MGTHTATTGDTNPETPICRETSAKSRKPNPPTIPVMIIVWIPPDRNDRNDTVAPKRTIAINSNGRA
ncbi:MAG: hypothetical protein RLZ98_3322, partial [Pseudomonadota bacterium]